MDLKKTLVDGCFCGETKRDFIDALGLRGIRDIYDFNVNIVKGSRDRIKKSNFISQRVKFSSRRLIP